MKTGCSLTLLACPIKGFESVWSTSNVRRPKHLHASAESCSPAGDIKQRKARVSLRLHVIRNNFLVILRATRTIGRNNRGKEIKWVILRNNWTWTKTELLDTLKCPTHYHNENSNENWINAVLYFVTPFLWTGRAKTRYWKIHHAIKNDRKLERFGKKCAR